MAVEVISVEAVALAGAIDDRKEGPALNLLVCGLLNIACLTISRAPASHVLLSLHARR